MNVEIGAETTLFPEKEYINGIAVAVRITLNHLLILILWQSQQMLFLTFFLPNQWVRQGKVTYHCYLFSQTVSLLQMSR
jgi:hypothetical protein